MKLGSVVRVETLRHLTKITALRRKAWSPETKFLQSSIWLRYNYYVQLVATRRNWMRVTDLNLAKGGGAVEAGRAVDCMWASRDVKTIF